MFNYADFMPHGHCFYWAPSILWPWVISNGMVALAYYSIPVALVYFIRKRKDIEFKWIFVLFALFILLCGTTHVMSIYTLWVPNYQLHVLIDSATAVVSILTAVLLWPVIPNALRIPSPRILEEKNRELHELNQTLENRVAERVKDAQQFAAIVGHSTDAIFSKSLDGTVLTWNNAAEKVFQYRAQDIVGKSIRPLIPRDKILEESELLKKIRGGQPAVPFESTRIRRDGLEIPVLMSMSPVRNEVGEIIAISAIIRDISQKVATDAHLRETTRELKERNEQLIRVNQAKDEFIANLSHELRSPLNIIIGYSNLLSSYTPGSPDFLTALDGIKRSAKTQMHLVEDLLDMSRIVSGKFSLSVSTHDLNEIVDNAIKAIEFAAGAKQITLVKEVDSDSPFIVCDADRIQQILWNLLANAVKFTGRGGQIALRTTRENGEFVFEVKDSGQGIAPQDLGHVFDRLWQSDATGKQEGGLGLGLRISKDLAEAHGGSIVAESGGIGKGATFRVRIPVHAVASPGHYVAQELKKLPLSGLVVLVVDDSPDAVHLIKSILESAGANVVTAYDGSEALELVRKNNIQFIVSDINMPNMDGFAFIESARQVENAQGKKVPRPAIALTARTGPGEKERAYQAGFQLHLIKPVPPELLVEKVLSVIKSQASET
jgi:PAS domain S-box-containing protein